MLSGLRRWLGGWGERGEARQADRPRIVDVGWLLDTTTARFIWFEPQRVKRSDPAAQHAKSVNHCPAVQEHDARLFEVACPIDVRLRLGRNPEGKLVLVSVDGANAAIRGKHLNQMVSLVAENEWRRPDRPIIQFITPYVFVSDEPVHMTQLPPYCHYQPDPWPGTLIGGRLPIHIWPRPMMWALEWVDPAKELVLKRGDPWFYVRFDAVDPTRPVRLFEAERTPELVEQMQGVSAVANYVRQTSRLYKVAAERRPARLLVRKARGERGDAEVTAAED